MSPASDDVLNDIRAAIERLKGAGSPCTDNDIASELGMTLAQLHAAMRQLFSDGQRIEPERPPG